MIDLKNSKDISAYGHFDEPRGCFILKTTPPRKWWNLHCSAININGPEMYSEVSNVNDGPTQIRDADGTTVELVSYDAKYHYLRDDDSGTVFCPAGAPAPQIVENPSVEFHREKTVMQSTCDGLHATQRVFVPQNHPIECTTITIKNQSDKPRDISVFSFALFQLTGCDNEGNRLDKENFAEVHPDMGGVLATNRNPALPTDRFKGYLITLNDLHNGNAYRDHFTREDYNLGTPKILYGWDCDGQAGYGPDCAGILQIKLHIPPGQTARADFILGQTASKKETTAFKKNLSPQQLDTWCEEARLIEKNRSETFTINVGHELYNGLFNIFVKKQLTNYLINKSGFRDNLQVDQALAISDYPAAQNNFIRALASQFDTGAVPHGFRPLNRLQYSDKPAWILQTLPALIKESGDFDLLNINVPYFESNKTGTVWEHTLQTMRYLANDTGPNGLCDQHYADWNDGLEATQASGDRESVFVTMQLCLGLRETAEIARRINDQAALQEANSLYQTFKNRLNDVAWDGEWYIRTICADGYRIGSKKSKYGQIFLNPQSWAVLSGVAEGQRAQAIMRQIDDQLEDDIGYRICKPPFAEYDPRVGHMSLHMPGNSENGGCYNHAAGFKGMADCLLGRSEQAWRSFTKVTPDSPENPLSNSGAEPFSYVNSYSSVKYIYGKSGYAWRTGTVGWMTQLLLEGILGARRDYDGLRINPNMPAALKTAKLTRHFRGSRYDITLTNTNGQTPQTIEVDDSKLDGNLLLPDGKQHTVRVTI